MLPTRRSLLLSATAAGLATTLPRSAGAVGTTQGAVMRERATAFLDALDLNERVHALSRFNGNARRDWNFFLADKRTYGTVLEDLTPPQRDLALDLLAAGTSALGFEKAQNIMLQQEILRDEWHKGDADRNRFRFSLQVFGMPSETGAWGWRWEGHHLSLTFTLLDDEVVSTTPSAFSSEPNTVPSGPYDGLVVLKDEETLGRALFADLKDASRRGALVWPESPGNILSHGGAERAIAGQQAGVPLGDLTQGQVDIAARLIEVYTTEVLPAPLAAVQTARLAEEDLAAIRFAWGGEDLDGSIYYRLTGRNLLIEFATLPKEPQHLHAIFHDLACNFGDHVA